MQKGAEQGCKGSQTGYLQQKLSFLTNTFSNSARRREQIWMHLVDIVWEPEAYNKSNMMMGNGCIKDYRRRLSPQQISNMEAES